MNETIKEPEHNLTVAPTLNLEEDSSWLNSLGIIPDEALFQTLQNLIDESSQDLRSTPDDRHQATYAMRDDFYKRIDVIKMPRSGSNSDRCNTAPPINRAVRAFRTLASEEINVSRVIKKHPAIMMLTPETMITNIENMNTLSINAVKVIESFPSALDLSPDNITSKMDNMRRLGLDPVRVVNSAPRTLGLTIGTITSKMDNMRRLGLDPVRVVNSSPNILNLAISTVEAKMENMRRLGLDPVRVMRSAPNTASQSSSTVEAKMDNMRRLGLDPVRVVHEYSVALGLSMEKVTFTIHALEKLGVLSAVEFLKEGYYTGFDTNWLMIPIESLLIALDKNLSNPSCNDVKRLLPPKPSRSVFVEEKLFNGSTSDFYESGTEALANEDQRNRIKSIGWLSNVYAMKRSDVKLR